MKNVFALAGVLTMTLLMSSVWAQSPEDYETTVQGAQPEIGVVLKSQRRDCPEGTKFFKNAFPSLTNGQGGGFKIETFSIDNNDVTMTVTWNADNSFGFNVVNGVAHKVGVKIDTLSLLYNYETMPVSGDEPLNKLVAGAAADVNHLDLCLTARETVPPVVDITSPLEGATVAGTVIIAATITDNVQVSSAEASVNGVSLGTLSAAPYQWNWDTTTSGTNTPTITVTATDTSGNTGSDTVNVFLDTDPPEVTITSPTDGDRVSGTVTVTAIVTDNVAVDSSSVTASVGGESLDPPFSTSPYQWTWDTAESGTGPQAVTVSATDTSANETTASVTVEVVNLLSDCFGILGDEDFGGDPSQDGYANGCNPTALANVQAPPDTEVCNVNNPPAFCFIAGQLYKPKPESEIAALGCDACTPGYCGPHGLPDPRMVCTRDGTGNCTDDWKPAAPLRSLTLADVAVGSPPGSLGKYVYGYKGCLVAARHVRGGDLFELYPTWPQDDPATSENEATGLVFVKKHSPEALLPPALVADCNVGTQHAAQAGYQPIDKFQSVDRLDDGTPAITLAVTQKCNAPRTLSRDNGIDVSNIIETDGLSDPLAFKYQMAQMQFDALFVALDCAEPTFIRKGRSRFSKVSSPINQAKAQFDNGTIAALGRARDDLRDAAFAIRASNWDVTPENCAGDALARTENLAWRMTDLICASTTPGTGECSASPYP